MSKELNTVPNQRVLTIHKEPTDKEHKYTVNNLEALGEAARQLQSKGGFKLYMYLSKNQDNYSFALSSTDFCAWSGLGLVAYNTSFKELIDKGYLIPKDASKKKEIIYTFYDKSRKEIEETIEILYPVEKVEEIKQKKDEVINNGFKF